MKPVVTWCNVHHFARHKVLQTHRACVIYNANLFHGDVETENKDYLTRPTCRSKATPHCTFFKKKENQAAPQPPKTTTKPAAKKNKFI